MAAEWVDTRQASDLAAAAAKVAHGGVQHGDNDPESSMRLRFAYEDLNRRFPPPVPSDGVMCRRVYTRADG